MRLFLTVMIALLFSRPALLLAHQGPRVWIGSMDGRVTTFASDNDLNPTAFTPSRLFTTELEPLAGVYTTNFPGYEVRPIGGNVAGGTTFGFNLAGPVLFFDESTTDFIPVRDRFGPPEPGPVPQISVSRGSSVVASGDGPVAGFDFFTFHQVGDHAHLSYTLLGDGAHAIDGPEGVYALPLIVTGGGLATSDTFYLLLGKDVEQVDPVFQDAVAVARTTLVANGVPGDMDCNGVLDESDIPGFVLAISDGNAYAAAHPGCSLLNADVNRDGPADGLDVNSFVEGLRR